MATAEQYAGIAAGVRDVQEYSRGRPERDARQAEAKSRQELSKLKLEEYKGNTENRQTQQELELQQLRVQTRQANAQNLRSMTYDAFRRYDGDSDPKHLNNFLREAKQNPIGKNQFGDIVRYEAMRDTPEMRQLLAQAGYTDPDVVFNDPELADDFVVTTMADGSTVLSDLTKAKAATGYTQYMTTQELEILQKRAALKQTLQGQESADTRMIKQIQEESKANGKELSLYEATQKYYEAKHTGRTTGSKLEREVDRVMDENPGMDRAEAMAIAKRRVEPRTSVGKNLEQADDVRANLDVVAGGDFFSADYDDPAVRRRVGPEVVKLEKLLGREMDREDRRTAKHIRSLMKLGETAGTELTQEETGLIDNLMFKVKKYFSDEVEGVAGVSSYEAFRNIFRNAMYGATLTKAEIEAFEAAAGTLGQQLGPALTQMQTSMKDLREQLNSVYDMNDEHVAHYYLGRSREELDDIIANLDERIALITQKTPELTVKDATKLPPVPEADQDSYLDELGFGNYGE